MNWSLSGHLSVPWGPGARSGPSRLWTWLGTLRVEVLRIERARRTPGWLRRVLLLDLGKNVPLAILADLLEIPGQGGMRPPDREKERWFLGVRSDVWEVTLGLFI